MHVVCGENRRIMIRVIPANLVPLELFEDQTVVLVGETTGALSDLCPSPPAAASEGHGLGTRLPG